MTIFTLDQVITADERAGLLLTATRSEASLALVAEIDAVTTALTGNVPLAEMLSWAPKETAARAWIAGTASPEETDTLTGEAAVTGEELADLAARIVGKADIYRAAIARLAGLRRVTETAIAAATDPAGVAAALSAARAALAD